MMHYSSGQKDHPKINLNNNCKIEQANSPWHIKGPARRNSHRGRATEQMIDKIQNAVEDVTGKMSSEDQSWNAVRHLVKECTIPPMDDHK